MCSVQLGSFALDPIAHSSKLLINRLHPLPRLSIIYSCIFALHAQFLLNLEATCYDRY